jgi:hypothetical protein
MRVGPRILPARPLRRQCVPVTEGGGLIQHLRPEPRRAKLQAGRSISACLRMGLPVTRAGLARVEVARVVACPHSQIHRAGNATHLYTDASRAPGWTTSISSPYLGLSSGLCPGTRPRPSQSLWPGSRLWTWCRRRLVHTLCAPGRSARYCRSKRGRR